MSIYKFISFFALETDEQPNAAQLTISLEKLFSPSIIFLHHILYYPIYHKDITNFLGTQTGIYAVAARSNVYNTMQCLTIKYLPFIHFS